MEDKHYYRTRKYFQKKAILTDGYYDSEPGKKLNHSIWTHIIRRKALNFLLSIVKKDSNIKSIVDLGCGRGDFTKEIVEKYPHFNRVEGVDSIEEVLDIAERETKHLKQINFRKGDLLSLPYDDKSFDITVCLNVFHHIHVEDQDKAIAEISRITKKHILLEIKNGSNFYYKYIHPKTFGGLRVYPTTSIKVEELLNRYAFKLKRKSGIFYWEWLSPMVQLLFSYKEWKKYIGFCLIDFV